MFSFYVTSFSPCSCFQVTSGLIGRRHNVHECLVALELIEITTIAESL